MWKLIVVTFILFQCHLLNSQKLEPIVSCDNSNFVIMKLVFKYFDDQHFMTLVDLLDYTLFPHSMDSLACIGGNNFRPVDVFNTKDVIFGPTIDSSSVSSYPTTHGYFVRCFYEEIEDGLFEKISNFNPRTKIMFGIFARDLMKVNDILRDGYEKYKMLNVAVTVFRPAFKNGFMNGLDISLYMYNPFSGSENVRSPEYISFNLSAPNLDETLDAIEAFQKRRLENLQQHPLKVHIFEYDMKSAAVYDGSGNIEHYTYPDGELVNAIAKVMNFTPVYLPPTIGPKYGFQMKSGNFTGGLAASEYGKADLVANSKLIANYNTIKSVFLQPITMTKLFFIIQKRVTKRRMVIYAFSELDQISKLLAIAITVMFPFIYLVVHTTENSLLSPGRRVNVIKTIFYIFGIIHNISMRHSKLTASRMIIIIILFYNLLASSLYQGSIVRNLNKNMRLGKITTIDQLFEQDFDIRMAPVMTYAFQGEGEDKITKELNKVSRDIEKIALPSENATKMLQSDYKLAYLWNDDAITGNYLDRYYDNQTGENYIEVVPESAFEFYIAPMVPKSSPFIDKFNQIINIYAQSGLNQYHVERASHDNTKVWIHRLINGFVPENKIQSLKLDEMSDCFKLYLVLSGFCLCIFILECFIEFLTTH